MATIPSWKAPVNTKIDSSQRSGDGWAVDDFQAMSGFYP